MSVNALKLAWRVVRSATNRIVIRNYREHCSTPPARRALVSYLMHPLLPPRPFRDRVIFSPFGIAQEIPRALNEMGYTVDIVNYDNTLWRPKSQYDLFIGHGGINFQRLTDSLAPEVTRIYFATGLHWREKNRRVEECISNLARRTGWQLPNDGCNKHNEDGAYSSADGIVYLGNRRVAETFSDYPQRFGINNAAYPVTWEAATAKNYDAGRRHFLFYQGPGNVFKGLDRVLEAFAGSSLQLHICQAIEPAFARAYHRLLFHSGNIHVYQFIRQRSALFYELASRCNWILAPACAEGQPGAVVEMMAHGLIPILSDDANISLKEWGIRLPECSADSIAATCAAASELSTSACRHMSAAVTEEVRERYSVEYFRTSFQSAVRGIMTRAGKQ